MEDKRFHKETDPKESGLAGEKGPARTQSEEMEREIQELEQVVEEGNELLGLPPLPPWND